MTKALADLCAPNRKICYGIVQPGRHAENGKPILRVKNLTGDRIDHSDVMRVDEAIETKYKRSRVREGDVLVSLVGSLGQVAIAGSEVDGWNIARAVGLIPVADRHHAEWVRYSIQSREAQSFIRDHANTTVQATFNLKDLAQLPIPYPSERARQEILSILGALDDKIELNRKMAATLEAMARALYRSWFVDFDPVHAKAERRAPAHMDAATAALFPDCFGEDGLPEGWALRPYLEAVEIVSGGTPKTSTPEYWGGEIPWYSVVDAPGEGQIFVTETEKTITSEGFNKCSAKTISRGTTIISARGTVGKLAMAGCNMTFNQSCYGLRGKRDRSDAFTYFATARAVEQLQSMAHGSVFSTITRKTFDGLRVVGSPEAILVQFEDQVGCLLNRIHSIVLENKTLATLRDTLLPRLMSGELRVGAAREQVEEAV